MQGAGLCKSGLAPHTSAHVYQTAVRCGLLYGCSSIYMNKSGLLELDKTQGKHLKSMLGIGYTCNCHTTPLLQALGIAPCSVTVKVSSLDLLKSSLSSSSVAGPFYGFMLNCDMLKSRKTVAGRAIQYCDQYNINLTKYILSDDYQTTIKKSLNTDIPAGVNGLVDSVQFLLSDFNATSRKMLHNLLKTF